MMTDILGIAVCEHLLGPSGYPLWLRLIFIEVENQ